MPRELWQLLALYLLGVNLLAFALMGIDKLRAKRNRRRIAERTLFLPAILYGALGGFLGMMLFRHKTRHWYFRLGFPALLILQVLLGGWLGGLWLR